ncbi:MAG: hypothetical protein U9R42_04610 [Bacteroidota bacterium]|nr:hypothetical protein [Bacteroidota bacterium]
MKKKFVFVFAFALILLMSCNNNEAVKLSDFEKTTISHRKVLLKELGPKFLENLNKTLYKAALKGEITAYKNDSLTESSKFTLEELEKLGGYEEVIQYAPDPEYPNYLIDSVIFNDFRLSDITGHEVSEIWAYDSEKNIYYGEINAFALRFVLTAAGIELNDQALFFVDFDDLFDIFSKEDVEKIKQIISRSLPKKVSDY